VRRPELSEYALTGIFHYWYIQTCQNL